MCFQSGISWEDTEVENTTRVKLNIVLMKHSRSNQGPVCVVYSNQPQKSHCSVKWEGLHPLHDLTEANGSAKSSCDLCAVQFEIATC